MAEGECAGLRFPPTAPDADPEPPPPPNGDDLCPAPPAAADDADGGRPTAPPIILSLLNYFHRLGTFTHVQSLDAPPRIRSALTFRRAATDWSAVRVRSIILRAGYFRLHVGSRSVVGRLVRRPGKALRSAYIFSPPSEIRGGRIWLGA